MSVGCGLGRRVWGGFLAGVVFCVGGNADRKGQQEDQVFHSFVPFGSVTGLSGWRLKDRCAADGALKADVRRRRVLTGFDKLGLARLGILLRKQNGRHIAEAVLEM